MARDARSIRPEHTPEAAAMANSMQSQIDFVYPTGGPQRITNSLWPALRPLTSPHDALDLAVCVVGSSVSDSLGRQAHRHTCRQMHIHTEKQTENGRSCLNDARWTDCSVRAV